ncbi:MAG: hypothetical protein QOI67_2013 [Gaiellaceae bacterium]|jgi:hypothetical protein|nr:hypothetical protein [Gaiellaceae bacterium]
MSSPDNHKEAEALRELDQDAERERTLVDIVRLDYDATLRALTGFVGTAAQIRAIGFAAWGVLFGLAVRDESGLLSGVALVLIFAFAYGDAYHAALYRRALARAISLEGMFDSYIERLGIDAENEDAVLRVRAKFETHRFGMHRTLRPLKLRELLAARPRAIFWLIYPAIAVITSIFIVIYSTCW